MLKQVMLGAGGIMLAALIFASSVTPNPDLAATDAPVAAPPVSAPPPVMPPPRQPRPAPVFAEDSGDETFGAPMIEAVPVDSGDVAAISPDPDNGEDTGGQQYTAKPGRSYPIPR